MGGVKGRPALLLAVLVYVTLDLSLATMPGAFQFDPADSVESIQGSRARATEVAVPPSPPEDAMTPAPAPTEITDQRVPTRQVARRRRFAMPSSSRSSGDPAPPSADPH